MMCGKNNKRKDYMPKANSKRGFTIIEVVLVLAIAGLIFLMVFIALPAMQRSQRDTQRRDSLSMMMTQITQYQANNRNKLPNDKAETVTVGNDSKAVETTDSGWAKFYNAYLLAQNDTFEDPNGNSYTIKAASCGTTTTNGDCIDAVQRQKTLFTGNEGEAQNYQISIVYNATCDGEKAVYNSGSRKIAILYKLEGGGTYCSNN